MGKFAKEPEKLIRQVFNGSGDIPFGGVTHLDIIGDCPDFEKWDFLKKTNVKYGSTLHRFNIRIKIPFQTGYAIGRPVTNVSCNALNINKIQMVKKCIANEFAISKRKFIRPHKTCIKNCFYTIGPFYPEIAELFADYIHDSPQRYLVAECPRNSGVDH